MNPRASLPALEGISILKAVNVTQAVKFARIEDAVMPGPVRTEQEVFPRVTIIVLNWNGRADTLECLASVSQIDYPKFDVSVVDNGSTDDSVPTIRENFPQVKIIETGRNLGFAGGNNFGIKYALSMGADYVLLLNNDTVVDRMLVTNLISVAQASPDGGIFGAKIYYFSEPDKIWYAGAAENGDGFYHVKQGETDDDLSPQEPYETGYVSGCALLIARSVVEKIGLMDSRFFLNYEETDWCYRAKRAGYKSYVVPTAKVWHKVAASSGGLGSPFQVYFLTRNLLLWAERNVSRKRHWVILKNTWSEVMPSLALGGDGAWMAKRVYWALFSWWKDLQARLHNPVQRARIIALRDYLLRRFGDCPDGVKKLAVQRDAMK